MSAPSTAISENVFQKPKRGRPTVWEISSDGDRLDMEFAREMKQIITRVIISSSASDPSKILSMKRVVVHEAGGEQHRLAGIPGGRGLFSEPILEGLVVKVRQDLISVDAEGPLEAGAQ